MTQFIALIAFSILLNVWHLNVLAALMLVFFIVLICQQNQHFFQLLKRLRWFFLVMFLIFLFNTPGEHMVSWSYRLKPTYEGLSAAFTQMLRIALMLAAVSFMLKQNSMQQLISGLYVLLKPLKRVGVNVERFATRLCLTMHYLEQEKADGDVATSFAKGLTARLDDAFANEDDGQMDITLTQARLTSVDYLVIVAMLIVSVLTFLVQG